MKIYSTAQYVHNKYRQEYEVLLCNWSVHCNLQLQYCSFPASFGKEENQKIKNKNSMIIETNTEIALCPDEGLLLFTTSYNLKLALLVSTCSYTSPPAPSPDLNC